MAIGSWKEELEQPPDVHLPNHRGLRIGGHECVEAYLHLSTKEAIEERKK